MHGAIDNVVKMLYIGLCGFETARSYEKYLAVTPFT
jgi:hypothetical protein